MNGPFAELASRIVTPARSGVYLTRNEIVLLARLEDGSVRLGERRRMLEDVFHSARGAEELGAVVARLIAFVQDSLANYRRLAADFPAAEVLLAPWIARATATERRLTELAEDLADP